MPPPAAQPATSYWRLPIAGLLAELGASPNGLSNAEAATRLDRYGPNVIRAERKRAAVLQFLSRFGNPLVIILLVASAISGATGDKASFFIITAIVLMSVTLDFVQEHRAGEAAERLRNSVAVRGRVLREERATDIPLALLVPGDVALLAAGDMIPGDSRILEAKDLFLNESLLTGEPFPMEKAPSELPGLEEVLRAGNSVFMGTSVISGTAKVLVCRTGQSTSLGEIADTLVAKAPANSFQQGTQQFGMLIMRLTILLVLFVLLVNALFHRPFLESFLFAVALAVGLTPELLPMVVSVTLARGALRMSAKKVIVKRLDSIQNLGSMDVLCTDKTGTLTEARIHLERHLDAGGKESQRVLELAYYNSFFETGLKSPLDDAILEHQEIDPKAWHKIDEVPFDFERRRVSVLLEQAGNRLLVVKGAPEDVLRLSETCEVDGAACPLDPATRAKANEVFESLSKEGFRVLGVASRPVPMDHPHAVVGDESALVFTGFAAFLDPPKESAKRALADLAAGGVTVKIVTGDNELVTQHVCHELGMPILGVLTGAQIQQMDDQALMAQVEQVNLFCRVVPAQKNRVILAIKRRGHVVGYLGDGVNDATALHSADIGISVDSAVDVAKDSADMILLEQDLGVINAGVLEGRRTYGNIMKYIMMGTSSNFGTMFSMAGAALLLPFLPMLPLQILLNNLLYDVSEIPIPLDNVDQEYLIKPHHWDMKFIRNFMLVMGPVSSVFDFLVFFILLRQFHAGAAMFHTGWFVESLATQVLVIFVIRTRGNPFKSHPNAWLVATSLAVTALALVLPYTPAAAHLGLVPLPGSFFLVLAAILVTYLLAAEGIKHWFFRHLAPA
jgi:Mg2+-importing ATPase